MYRQQLVWTGWGWQYVNVFVPVNTHLVYSQPYYRGFYPGGVIRTHGFSTGASYALR